MIRHLRLRTALLALPALALLSLTGCQTVYDGNLADGRYEAGEKVRRIVLLPLDNATSDPAAPKALRDLTASALAARGLRFSQTEETLIAAAKKNAQGENGLYPELAKLTGARYFITGTVHEYRYMSDLEGSPAVGYSLRLIDARDGRTLWTGSAANTGYGWQSLSELCADSARKLADAIPVVMHDKSDLPRVCLRTGRPAYYTETDPDTDTYEVDTLDGRTAYTVRIRDGVLPPVHPDYAKGYESKDAPVRQVRFIMEPVTEPEKPGIEKSEKKPAAEEIKKASAASASRAGRPGAAA